MRYAWIDLYRDQYSVSRLCRLLSVSRSGYCQWRVRSPSRRALASIALDEQVAKIHAQSRGTYGRLRIQRRLEQQGFRVGAERVRRSLLRQGLRPAYRRPYRITTDSDHRQPVVSNILDRRFDGWKPNEAWVSDITFVATDEGWVYLAVIMDLASRKIIGWAMSNRIRAELVCEALRSAYWAQRPARGTILHSDQGSQYASRAYRQLAKDFGMVMSMSRRANCWDNSAMESFFKTLKVERIYRLRYRTRAEARLDIVEWVEGFYNRERIHSSIGYRTPVAMEMVLKAA